MPQIQSQQSTQSKQINHKQMTSKIQTNQSIFMFHFLIISICLFKPNIYTANAASNSHLTTFAEISTTNNPKTTTSSNKQHQKFSSSNTILQSMIKMKLHLSKSILLKLSTEIDKFLINFCKLIEAQTKLFTNSISSLSQ